jgi:hypothetical protein
VISPKGFYGVNFGKRTARGHLSRDRRFKRDMGYYIPMYDFKYAAFLRGRGVLCSPLKSPNPQFFSAY